MQLLLPRLFTCAPRNLLSATVSQPIANPELEKQLRQAAKDGKEDDVRSLLDPEKRVNVNAANSVSTSARLSLSRRPTASLSCGAVVEPLGVISVDVISVGLSMRWSMACEPRSHHLSPPPSPHRLLPRLRLVSCFRMGRRPCTLRHTTATSRRSYYCSIEEQTRGPRTRYVMSVVVVPPQP